jgi:diguanylate cyclase (GGDEF)-like protein
MVGPTIGVLSACFGGDYFGAVMGGIASGVRAAHGRLIAIQTLDAGTFAVDLAQPPVFRAEAAWDHVQGFLVILNAVDAAYLTAVRDAGKPVVTISDTITGFECPVVLPDNRTGMAEAVRHLVEHGHTKIAFAGFPAQKDMRERYEAYQDTLRELGIEPEPELFYNTGNNQESGGVYAAQQMLRDKLPSTAVVTGNDYNAIGLMRTLSQAGCVLPGDQAVIGFDDINGSLHQTPSLSSVRQKISEGGYRAVELLVRQIEGEEVPPGLYHLPTEFAARESCGCMPTLALEYQPDVGGGHDSVDLAGELARIFPLGQAEQVRTTSEFRTAVDFIVRELDCAAAGVEGPGYAELKSTLGALQGLAGGPEQLVQMIRGIQRYGRCVADRFQDPANRAAVDRVESAVQKLIVGLSQADTRAQQADNERSLSTLTVQYNVSMTLLSGDEEDPRNLSWLHRTNARAGCLGLRPAESQNASCPERVNVAGTYDSEGTQIPTLPRDLPVRSFPPREVVDLADLDQDLMCYIAPLKVRARDWGMLALVGPVDADVPTGRETMNQWAALLTASLEHESVLQALRKQEEQLRRAALYDELTDLPNRTLFLDRLRQSILRSRRRPNRFAVLMLDLDGFKVVNDSLGHLAGDQLLIEVAKRITASLRDLDTAARFGGDEFAVLLEDVGDPNGPIRAAERLQAAVSSPYNLDGQEVVVSASIGVAVGVTGYQDAADILRDADVAMYWAKSREKGTHAVFDPTMHQKALARLRIEGELRQALEARELEVHYQPIVSLLTGRTESFEALIRWRHPIKGLIPPGDFLPVAEECGLSVAIGRWVLEQACAQLEEWRGSSPDGENIRVSINISNRHFWREGLLSEVEDALTRHALPARQLVLEITEGVIMHDVELARTLLASFHDLGTELHIDDFGTGYSSLDALHNLPIDALKIDRSFIARMGTGTKSRELVRTIVMMAGNLGLDVIAEGIETEPQYEYLRGLSCQYGQGFLFSRAVPADQAGEYIGRALMIEAQPMMTRARCG